MTQDRFAGFTVPETYLVADGLAVLQPDDQEAAFEASNLEREARDSAMARDRIAQSTKANRDLIKERNAREAVRLLKANGFTEEIGGGGCVFMSRYWPNGACVWATCTDGGGMPSMDDYTVCAYGRDVTNDDTTDSMCRFDFEPHGRHFLPDAIRMAVAAAEAIDSLLAAGPCPRCASVDAQEAAAEVAVADKSERVPLEANGFTYWTDGICQEGKVYQSANGGVMLTDLEGQENATAESWALMVYRGQFPFDGDADEAMEPVHTIEKTATVEFSAAFAAALAMADAL